jgi:hypothetical protein
MNREPLQSSSSGAILQSNMMGHPMLKCNFDCGNHCKFLKYSIGYKLWLFAPTSRRATSTFNNVQQTLGKNVINAIVYTIDNIIWNK